MRALAAFVVLLALGSGCASTQLSGRHVSRVGPLRGALAHPQSAEEGPVLLDAGRDVLDDAELERMKRELAAHLVSKTSRLAVEHAPAASPRGTVRVQRCTLSAAPTPRATVYLARCRLALEVGGVAVASVEAQAERRARARAVTEEQAAEIRKQVRNPLLDYDDARAALISALDEALRLLITGGAPAVREGDDAVARFDSEAMRSDALKRLGREKGPALAASCVDLGRFGLAADGAALAPHLDDESALVRRACATAVGELAARDAYPALQARAEDPDPEVKSAVALALERLRAIYPDLPVEPSKPSKSSTDGGED